MSNDHRTRIYDSYVTSSTDTLVPLSALAGFAPRLPFLRKVIDRYFPKNRNINILDLGCGHGAFLYALQLGGYQQTTGVDCSPQQVAEAKRLGIHGVEEGDLFEYLKQQKNASQDVIICFDVIEHFSKSELVVFVDEVYRVLKSGGMWLIHVPNGESPFVGRILFGDFTHELAFTRRSITQLLLASGFSRVICSEDAPVPHGFKSSLRWLLWKWLRAMLRLYLLIETGTGGKECIFSQNFLAVGNKD